MLLHCGFPLTKTGSPLVQWEDSLGQTLKSKANVVSKKKKNVVHFKLLHCKVPQKTESDGVLLAQVACFGHTKYTAFLKAMMSSGFKLPRPGGSIMVGVQRSILPHFLPFVKRLDMLGYTVRIMGYDLCVKAQAHFKNLSFPMPERKKNHVLNMVILVIIFVQHYFLIHPLANFSQKCLRLTTSTR